MRAAEGGLQLHEPQLVEIRIDTDSIGKFVTALTAAVQVLDHPALDEVVDLPELSPAVTNFEVIRPACQMLVELLDQFAHWFEALLRPSEFPNHFPFLIQRLLRWK